MGSLKKVKIYAQPCLGVNTLKLFYGPLTKLTFDSSYGDEMPSRNDGVLRKTKYKQLLNPKKTFICDTPKKQ